MRAWRALAPCRQRPALVFARAELTEVLRGAWALIREKLHLDPPGGHAANRDIKENL